MKRTNHQNTQNQNTKPQNNVQSHTSRSRNQPVSASENKKPNTNRTPNVARTKSTNVLQNIATKPEEVRALRELEGAFEFRSFQGFGGAGEPIFTDAEVTHTGTAYETQKKDWAVGDGFQLWLTTELNNAYIYVFSINQENKVQVHWPRKASLNSKFKGMNESAFVIKHAKVRIPGKNKKGNETVLYVENPGTDHLVVLFSTKKIRSFKSICRKMQYRKDNLSEDLLQLLGNHAIPAADIDYDYDKMRFEVSTRSIGYIVPLVLSVTAE